MSETIGHYYCVGSPGEGHGELRQLDPAEIKRTKGAFIGAHKDNPNGDKIALLTKWPLYLEKGIRELVDKESSFLLYLTIDFRIICKYGRVGKSPFSDWEIEAQVRQGSVIQRIGNRKRYINATELVSAVQQLSAHLVEGLEPVEVKE